MNFEKARQESFFLWGAKQTGKNALLQTRFPDALWFDLALTVDYMRLNKNRTLIRKSALNNPEQLVVLDEIQRIPELMDEVHWLIENKGTRFILCSSNPRKIINSEHALLKDITLQYRLYPLTSGEIPDFKLLQALNNGMLPEYYDSLNVKRKYATYINDYHHDTIASESKVKHPQIFNQFMKLAAQCNGEPVNNSAIAAKLGVHSLIVKEYYRILEDTLMGCFLPAFLKKPKRKIFLSPKFYLFDIGVVNALCNHERIEYGGARFEQSLKHFICQELHAHSHYSGLNYPVSYWRTTTHLEVDFVLGNPTVAIAVKGTNVANDQPLKALIDFAKEYRLKKQILITNDSCSRQISKVQVMSWKSFLQQLWNGDVI
ncbi:MAG: AAA family ATPase [Bacteroidales bacterium]|nr:AAA family ATPase [Bacteroidales bacterium]